MGRALVILSTVSGGIGLGLALGYFVMVVAAFQPGGEAIAEFMVGSADTTMGLGFALVVVPYALLMLNLWLRANVGRILLERGDTELARRFAERGQHASILRARREALANRVVLMRLAIRAGEYARAEEIATTAKTPRRGEVVVAFHRWRLEAALRRENLVLAAEIVAQAWPFSQRGEEAAGFCAAAGELAVRNGDDNAWVDWRDRAEFAHAGSARLTVSAAFAALRFGGRADDDRERAEALGAAAKWLDDVPLAAGEVAAVKAALLRRSGAEGAFDAIAEDVPCDDRSTFVLERLRAAES